MLALVLLYLSIASFKIKNALVHLENLVSEKIPQAYNLSASSIAASIALIAAKNGGAAPPLWLNLLPKVKEKFGKYQIFVNPAKLVSEGLFELSQALKNFKLKK